MQKGIDMKKDRKEGGPNSIIKNEKNKYENKINEVYKR